MTITLEETGLFAVDHAARTIRGVLVPWGQRSRTNRSKNRPVTFPRGSVRVPRDVSVVTLNFDHDRFRPLGRAVSVVDEEAGLVATFALAETDEADAWLEDRGDFVKLSAEVRNLTRDGEDRGAADLTGAALVTEGAFEGAALFSVDDVDPDGVVDGDTDDDVDPDAGEDDVVDDVDDDEPDEEPDEEGEGQDMTTATAPETMLAGAQRRAARPDASTPIGEAAFFGALEEWRRTGESETLASIIRAERETGLFALSNVTIDGAGAVGLNVTQTQWLGELWAGRSFARKVISLLASGPLTSLTMKGWRWVTKPEVSTWAGNKTDIPSNEPTTEPDTFGIQRFAGGHDIAREYFDFGETEFINSYLRAMVDSYARKSDAYVLTSLKAAATAFTPGTVPGGVDEGLAAIVDGALAVIAAEATPSFALVAPDVYRPFLFTPENAALEYLSMSLGLEEGTVDSFRIVPDARLAAGDVIVGARDAAIVRELPGSPIRTSAVDIVKGGFDEALFGYIGLQTAYPEGIVKANISGVAVAASKK